ncbi:MAG: right-handed parallel beta-helix repeat-containing protein [Planctomycetota bacterium]|jgi:hypothetical protein
MKSKQSTGMIVVIVLTLGASLQGRTLHVATDGRPNGAGTEADPYQTIQQAADVMGPGDVCVVHEGVYRETVRLTRSGRRGAPIRFVAARGERVVLDGTDRLTGAWQKHRANIYRLRTDVIFEQLFVDGEMMIEARWPNTRHDLLFDRSTWAEADPGSAYGKMVSRAMAETGIDWTGAIATLNVSHQFWTWTRTVDNHKAGGSEFTYAQTLGAATDRFVSQPDKWEDDYFYLSGKLEALDAPTEWFLDRRTGRAYLWTADGSSPAVHNVSVKQRDHAFVGEGVNHVQIVGFDFFATTLNLTDVNHCLVENCRMKYPSFVRRFREEGAGARAEAYTRVTGDHNTFRRVGIAWAKNAGVIMVGSFNTAENCIVRDVNWVGSLTYPAVRLFPDEGGRGNVVRRCTLYNAGNAILAFNGFDSVIEYNHVYNGGLLCKDVSLVYTQLPTTRGSVIRYNWVHGCFTDGHSGRGGQGGLGIRADDQTRGVTAHHNVVWHAGRDGVILKGDENRAYNNTVFAIGASGQMGNYINFPTREEPVKPWRFQYPLLERQNDNSLIYNNAATTITSYHKLQPFPNDHRKSNNYQGADYGLMDVGARDFRPRPGSPLIDAGRVIEGVTDGFSGEAPDIGAYEFGAKPWKPGADWVLEFDY